MTWPWTMLLQLRTFCCGETRRKHLYIFFLSFYCFTGFSFLEELSWRLLQSFCFWLMLSFLDMVLYHQRCKYWCLWKLSWMTLLLDFVIWLILFPSYCFCYRGPGGSMGVGGWNLYYIWHIKAFMWSYLFGFLWSIIQYFLAHSPIWDSICSSRTSSIVVSSYY